MENQTMTKARTGSSLTACCSAKPQIDDRPLLSQELAGDLESLFKVLANRTRLRMLHTMVCCREICVTELAERLSMKPQAVSNQLQRLVDRRIVSCRRSGSNIFYKFVDPCVQILLERGLCLIQDTHNASTPALLGQGDVRAAWFNPTENASSGPEDEPDQ